MVRTTLFFAYFWLSVILSSPIALILWISACLGFRGAETVTGRLVRIWARSVLGVMGVTVQLRGMQLLPDDKRICFVANHQGDVDILLILAFMPGCVGFITKSQAAWIPFLNIWIFALGGIFIDREKVSAARRSIERGVERVRSGRTMAIFPEGTRSRKPRMGPFRNGSFKLATRAEAVLVPLSIHGTYKAWEERKRIVPCSVSLTVHEPIPTQSMTTEEKRKLPDIVRLRIAQGLPGECDMDAGRVG